MNRNEASKLAETVTIEELKQMFKNAQENIKDWSIACRVNKGMSLGAAYNILSAGLGDKSNIESMRGLVVTNMIWAFGEYLPGYEKPVTKVKPDITPHHQEPKFIF